MKKHHWPNFQLRIVTKSQQKRSIFEADCDWWSWFKGFEPAQTVPKPVLTASKVLLCVWWVWQKIVYYELRPYDQYINSDLCCQQMDGLKEANAQKCPVFFFKRRGNMFQQDRQYTSSVTHQKLRELGLETLMHHRSSYIPVCCVWFGWWGSLGKLNVSIFCR